MRSPGNWRHPCIRRSELSRFSRNSSGGQNPYLRAGIALIFPSPRAAQATDYIQGLRWHLSGCHSQVYGIDLGRCSSCHDARVSAKHSNARLNCMDCHTEHKGADFRPSEVGAWRAPNAMTANTLSGISWMDQPRFSVCLTVADRWATQYRRANGRRWRLKTEQR